MQSPEYLLSFNPLSANPTKWSNTLKQFVGNFESQDELKSRKIDDLGQYGRRESLRFSGFEVKENESKEECESKVKSYVKNCFNVDIEESEFNRIHRIGP